MSEEEVEGTSYAPLTLGIIATVISIPTVMCSTVCGSVIGAIEKVFGSESNYGVLIMILGFLAVSTGLTGSINARRKPVEGGIELLIAAILSAVIMFLFFNIFQLIVVILYIIACIIAFTQERKAKKTELPPNATIINNVGLNNTTSKASAEYEKKSPETLLINFKNKSNQNTKGNPYK